MPRRKGASLATAARHEWDSSLVVGDLVTLIKEIPHIYVVKEIHSRQIMTHDLYNHPSISESGVKEGADICPLLVVQRVREAPSYGIIPLGRTYSYKIDAYKVQKIAISDVQFVLDNLNDIKTELLSKSTISKDPQNAD